MLYQFLPNFMFNLKCKDLNCKLFFTLQTVLFPSMTSIVKQYYHNFRRRGTRIRRTRYILPYRPAQLRNDPCDSGQKQRSRVRPREHLLRKSRRLPERILVDDSAKGSEEIHGSVWWGPGTTKNCTYHFDFLSLPKLGCRILWISSSWGLSSYDFW